MTGKARTLVILTPGFPANEADTTCVPARAILVKTLKKNNPSLNIIVIAFQYPFFSGNYSYYGAGVISLNGRNRGKFYRLLVWWKAWSSLLKIKKENEVIGILSFWLSECALIAGYFSRLYHIKQFTWLLGQDAKKGNIYYKLTKPHASTLIALSDFIADQFFNNYSVRPAHVVPVGIDTSMFDFVEKERDIDVMGAGSLIPLKRYHLFIEIIKEIKPSLPDIRCVICGKGPEKERLLRLIEKAGLQNNISLRDEVPHREVLQLMQQSKIFLHTSEYEGYGTVLSEALYAGAQVVSFCKPMKETFEHEYLVSSKEKAVCKLMDILNDKNREHRRVLAYSINDVAEKILQLFHEQAEA